MLRLSLTWLLLLNYLLVVGAGLVVSRPAPPLFSAAHPYVHSKDCQQHNYLRLDCFEHCNGDQRHATAKLPTGTGLHYLAQLKGLDVHQPSGLAVALAAPHWVPLALAVGFALVGIVLWGSLAGSMLPLLLKKVGFDPATSSAPFVATLVDVTGLVIYFTVAYAFLHGTLL